MTPSERLQRLKDLMIIPDDNARMCSETVQIIAYLLKRDAHRYDGMTGPEALHYAANALLAADRDCLARKRKQ